MKWRNCYSYLVMRLLRSGREFCCAHLVNGNDYVVLYRTHTHTHTLYFICSIYSRSFYHTDPRWQILTFFNDVALLGTKSMEKSEGIIDEHKKFQIPFILRVFVKAGVFSVWRPTSNEAIKYMMTGEGVSFD